MLYDITLRMAYRYDFSADAGRHIARLMPADVPGEQRLVAGSLGIVPKPDEWVNFVDFFGNACVEVGFDRPHTEIVFAVQSRVERHAPGEILDMSPPLAGLADEIFAWRSMDGTSPHHFLGASPRVPIEQVTTDHARAIAVDGRSVLETVRAIGLALHEEMRFDPKATTVETPMLEAFERRHGVCQDFTHVMIACLRGIGIPAGYVSGFLRTIPPKGEERLEGADAMHAWVRAWCGADLGWVEFDPTNAIAAGEDHVVVARGRDYFDVSPIKGTMRTAGPQSSTHSVDVVPVREAAKAS
ncbi:transglutaminase family protein [Aquibium microcysteis]|uniref:transglutaminase family protein n=1 Tax=Aquibium microcysteis TaxID=675281 RepID=UPI00165CF77E|nr:transglutaminase family protein [Aquibium microcysteis]